MEQSPLENAAVVQLLKIPIILWKYNVHYCGQNIPQLHPILSQMNPVHTLLLYIFKIHLNSIIPSMHRSSKGSPVYRIFSKKIVHTSYFSHV
jgi:hypothetical protein